MPTTLTLEGHHNLVRWNRTLAQDLPASLTQRQIHDRRRLRPPGGPTVDDEWNPIADLVAHTGSVRTLGCSLQIRGCRRDREAKLLHHRSRNRRIGNAQ